MDSAEYFHAWLSAFAFTQALEVPIYVVGLGRDRAGGPPGWPARVGLAFLASAVTHPCVWYVIPRIFYSPWFDGLADAWPALDERRYEVFFVKGRPVRLLVAEDGIPLAAKQRAKEEARAREKAEAIAAGKVAREQPGMRLSRVMERYDFKAVAREEREGRSVLVLEFAPLPGKRELDSDNVLRALHGRLFVDEAEGEVARAEIRNSGGIKLRRGLGVSLGALDVVLDFQRLDDGVWLPRRVEATARGRVLWLKGFRQQTITSYSNFRRFGVETEEEVRP